MAPWRSKTKSLMTIGLVAVLCLLVVIFGLVIYVMTENRGPCAQPSDPASPDPVGEFLKRLNVTDGLDIGWYHDTGSRDQLDEALKGSTHHIFVTSVSLRQDVLCAGSYATTPFPLTDWLDTVFSAPGKGVQIELSSEEETEAVCDVLRLRGNENFQPVWLKVNVVTVTGKSTTPVNLTRLAEKLSGVGFAVSWAMDDCCPDGHTKSTVREMWGLFKGLRQPVNVIVPADQVVKSWPNLKWLLTKSANLTLTMTTATCANNTAYEMLNVRNDFRKTRIFYDISQRTCLDRFRSLAFTAGSALHHFAVDNDAAQITWAHAVNSREKLRAALADDGVMFLEADVLLRYQGTENQTDIPIMAHPPAIDSDITLSDWLDAVMATDRGIKLDFKSIDAVAPSLDLLNRKRGGIRQPVWLNADVLAGPNANVNAEPVNVTQLLRAVDARFPEATLSLGWKTGWTNSPADEGYSEVMVRAMVDLCRPLPQPVTFPIRAAAARRSWCQLQWLLDQSYRYTITIWTAARDAVTREDMNYIRRHSQKNQVYFDLPQDLMPDV